MPGIFFWIPPPPPPPPPPLFTPEILAIVAGVTSIVFGMLLFLLGVRAGKRSAFGSGGEGTKRRRSTISSKMKKNKAALLNQSEMKAAARRKAVKGSAVKRAPLTRAEAYKEALYKQKDEEESKWVRAALNNIEIFKGLKEEQLMEH